MFAFSHDTLKERFHVLAMDIMHTYGIYILNVIFVTSSFCSDAKSTWGRHVYFNYLALRLNLVYFHCNWQTNCKKVPIVIDYAMVITFNGTGTIYAILMTS